MAGGWRIIKTMGQRITKFTPFGGFAAETAGAITLMGTAHFGIAVRTTHTLLGAGIFHLLAALCASSVQPYTPRFIDSLNSNSRAHRFLAVALRDLSSEPYKKTRHDFLQVCILNDGFTSSKKPFTHSRHYPKKVLLSA